MKAWLTFPLKKAGAAFGPNSPAILIKPAVWCLLMGLCFRPGLSWGQMQYSPLSSAERHALSFAAPIKNDPQKSWTENLSTFVLKYGLYFPEIEAAWPDFHKKAIAPSLQLGILLRGKNNEICEKGQNIKSGAYHLGLRGKNSYFSYLQPFVEAGLARSFCHGKKISSFRASRVKLSHYFSYGLLLSLKIFDRAAIYSLDQDYGVNDIGITAECRHYYPKIKGHSFCQLGLQMSF